MIAQLSGSDTNGLSLLFLLAAALQLVLVVAFFVMVSNVGTIRKILEGMARGSSTVRICSFCRVGCDPLASVCPHCTREVGAWTAHNDKWWVVRGGAWVYLNTTTGQWMPADAATPPPSRVPAA